MSGTGIISATFIILLPKFIIRFVNKNVNIPVNADCIGTTNLNYMASPAAIAAGDAM